MEKPRSRASVLLPARLRLVALAPGCVRFPRCTRAASGGASPTDSAARPPPGPSRIPLCRPDAGSSRPAGPRPGTSTPGIPPGGRTRPPRASAVSRSRRHARNRASSLARSAAAHILAWMSSDHLRLSSAARALSAARRAASSRAIRSRIFLSFFSDPVGSGAEGGKMRDKFCGWGISFRMAFASSTIPAAAARRPSSTSAAASRKAPTRCRSFRQPHSS